jgi:hypothetical protein
LESSTMVFLLSLQNQDGGWGYGPQQNSAVEPTSAALLSIRESLPGAHALRAGIGWLRSAQHDDGGWGFNSSDPESAWQTAWALLALRLSGEAGDSADKGVKWLLSATAMEFGEESMQFGRKVLAIDFSLRGWPWLPGEATFIEPTALALLALHSIRGSTEAKGRINEAVRYIQDRRCPEGGWNVGNPVMFNSPLPARAHPTALVLLALSRFAPGTINSQDIKALRSAMHRDGGALGLAWGLLALRTMGEDDKLEETRLASMQGQNGGWADNPYITAVALMAMRGYL